MDKWEKLASDKEIKITVKSLGSNGITAFVVENAKMAKKKALEIIPPHSQVMNMTSATLDSIGLPDEILKKGKFNSVRNELEKLDRKKDNLKMQELGAAPEWAIGSVHAVTLDGEVFIASNTGSQLPAYAYGATHVVWIVGTQKIVKNKIEAMKRLYEHCLPLESERARIAYGVEASAINKILIINKEVKPERINLIFVKEKLGF